MSRQIRKVRRYQSDVDNLRRDNTIVKLKKGQKTNNDWQNTTQKTKYWATRAPLNPRGEVKCAWRRVSRITFIWYDEGQQIGRQNNSKIFRIKKTTGPKQEGQNRLRSPMLGERNFSCNNNYLIVLNCKSSESHRKLGRRITVPCHSHFF
jgi:hypothetical protein